MRALHPDRALLAAACAALVATSASAQSSENVTILGQIWTSEWHADLWGYAADGVEIAIQGVYDRTYFFDVTDPANIQIVYELPGPDSIWRDIKTYDHYAYVVNDDLGLGGRGIQVVDMSDPLNPVLVREVMDHFTTAHNVWIDQELGLLFAPGAGSSTFVYDLIADPSNPTYLYDFNQYYVHDMHSRGGIGYMSAVYEGTIDTVDLTNIPTSMNTLDAATTVGAFTHNSWTDAENEYCYTGDEVSGGPVTIVNVSNPSNISVVGSWSNPDDPTATMHNVVGKGDYLYIGWYHSGFIVLDISDRENPFRTAYYDTYAGTGSGYDGGWGCYVDAPSGNIYYSDINNGLFIFEVDLGIVSVPGASTSTPIHLSPAAPNPMLTEALIQFELNVTTEARLTVYDARGRFVRDLMDGALGAGPHAVTWDARDASGKATSPGVYYVTLTSDGTRQTQKIVRAR